MFEAVDRCNLLDDAFNLARATQLGYPVALNLTRYLEAELHYFPWSSVGYGLGYISSQLYTDYEFGNWRVRHCEVQAWRVRHWVVDGWRVRHTGIRLEGTSLGGTRLEGTSHWHTAPSVAGPGKHIFCGVSIMCFGGRVCVFLDQICTKYRI